MVWTEAAAFARERLKKIAPQTPRARIPTEAIAKAHRTRAARASEGERASRTTSEAGTESESVINSPSAVATGSGDTRTADDAGSPVSGFFSTCQAPVSPCALITGPSNR